jgi:hypothetical protein
MDVVVSIDVLAVQGALPERQMPADSLGGMLLKEPGEGKAVRVSCYKGELHSPRYEFWRRRYFERNANQFHLQALAAGGVLAPDEIELIKQERLAEKGI